MNENTVKPALRRKREKRVVENDEFAAFARRILRAYLPAHRRRGRKALRSWPPSRPMWTLSPARPFGACAPATATRGPKSPPVSALPAKPPNSAGGDPADRGALDRRLLKAGIHVTVPQLVTLFADHHPGVPAGVKCPGCEHTYAEGETDCPTNVVVRPLLHKRRNEARSALTRLTPAQYEDLLTPAQPCVPRSPWPGRTRSPGSSTEKSR